MSVSMVFKTESGDDYHYHYEDFNEQQAREFIRDNEELLGWAWYISVRGKDADVIKSALLEEQEKAGIGIFRQ